MFGPVATSLPFTLIIKPMTSMGSHFYSRLMLLINLSNPLSPVPTSLPRKGVLRNKQSSRSVSKTPVPRSPLPGNIPASGRPFPPALLLPVVPVPLFPFFSCWQWNDVGGGTNVAARFCKHHSWRLLVILHPLPSAPWVLFLWAKDLIFLHFPCISGSRLGPDSAWQPGWACGKA